MEQYVIQTENLTKQYDKKAVVNKLNIRVAKGKIYGLLGRNGAGKTTTIRMMMGLLAPTSGKVSIFGDSFAKEKKAIYHRIGSMIETPSFYENLTGRENLELIASLRGLHKRDAVKTALAKMDLTEAQNKRASKYSLGMKQRLGIAMAIMHEPELLILDEPTNGLDPIGIQQMRRFLRSLCEEHGTTILISSHILSEIEQMADVVGIIHDGVLLEESDLDSIRYKNRQYVKLSLSSMEKAVLILERDFHIKDMKATNDQTLLVYEIEQDWAAINRSLNGAEIGVSEIALQKGSLEDYFVKVTGGVTIG